MLVTFAVSACECHVHSCIRSLCLLSLCFCVAGIMKVWQVCQRQLAHGMHVSTKLHVSKIWVLGILQTTGLTFGDNVEHLWAFLRKFHTF